ncbi:MAG: carboxypeptidase-like regulatory domain-containing protein [Acidobacteriaceae bacterium]
MSSKRTTRWMHRWLPVLAVCAITGVALVMPSARAQLSGQPSIRTLSGTVTDDGHEPIRGAIVELHDQKSDQMVSYLTDANGHYNFKRLDGNADYDVHVVYRGHHSPSRAISKFDSHMNKVINFKLRSF